MTPAQQAKRERQDAILVELALGPTTCGHLCRLVGVNDRTLRRDIGEMRAVGKPIRSTWGLGGGYELADGARPLVTSTTTRSRRSREGVILDRLAVGGLATAAELATLAGACVLTIRRDIRHLVAAGIEIRGTRGRTGGYELKTQPTAGV